MLHYLLVREGSAENVIQHFSDKLVELQCALIPRHLEVLLDVIVIVEDEITFHHQVHGDQHSEDVGVLVCSLLDYSRRSVSLRANAVLVFERL